jgi:hypothetical protein
MLLRMFPARWIFKNRMRFTGLTWVVCFLMAASCRKNLYPGQSVNNELVVLAEITAGDSIEIPVSKSIQVGSGGIISFQKVNSAVVTVSRPSGSVWQMKLNTGPDFSDNPASIYTSKQRPRYNTIYNLDVQDPLSGTVTAQTTIPSPIHISHFDTSSGVRAGIPVLTCSFTLTDPPDTVNLYVFEALKQLLTLSHYFYWQGKRYDYDEADGRQLYLQVRDQPGVNLLCDTVVTQKFERLGVFTDDNNVANAQVSSLDSVFGRIFLPGSVFNGAPYTTSFSIDRKYFLASDSLTLGRVLVQIKSVSSDLYQYLFWYEKYKSDVGSVPPGQLYSPPGNIQNGLGIFGGSSKRQWIYYFDKLR